MSRVISLLIFSSTIAFYARHENLNNASVSKYRGAAKPGTIGEIPLPAGFARTIVEKDSFGDWLRQIKLKEDSKVYLYNGKLKADQSVQYAVLNIAVSKGDLQQCADAVMRLRAEYFFSRNDIHAIHFKATDGTILSFARWLKGERYKPNGNHISVLMSSPSHQDGRIQLEQFLEIVFTYCGTLSLEEETHRENFNELQIGDVFVKGGSPGHAMIVVDIGLDPQGRKIFMLAQSYMPAQDIHIVKNPVDVKISPWYSLDYRTKIITPGWIFDLGQLRRW